MTMKSDGRGGFQVGRPSAADYPFWRQARCARCLSRRFIPAATSQGRQARCLSYIDGCMHQPATRMWAADGKGNWAAKRKPGGADR